MADQLTHDFGYFLETVQRARNNLYGYLLATGRIALGDITCPLYLLFSDKSNIRLGLLSNPQRSPLLVDVANLFFKVPHASLKVNPNYFCNRY